MLFAAARVHQLDELHVSAICENGAVRAYADCMQACVQCVYISSFSYFCSPHLFTLFRRSFFPSFTRRRRRRVCCCYYYFFTSRSGAVDKIFELCHVISEEECNFLKFLPWEMLLYILSFFLFSQRSTIAATAPTVKFHKFSGFSERKKFYSCIKFTTGPTLKYEEVWCILTLTRTTSNHCAKNQNLNIVVFHCYFNVGIGSNKNKTYVPGKNTHTHTSHTSTKVHVPLRIKFKLVDRV